MHSINLSARCDDCSRPAQEGTEAVELTIYTFLGFGRFVATERISRQQ
jgi:hypothetical protein